MLPCSAIACAWTFTSHRLGARSGARILDAGRIGLFISMLMQAYPVFRKDSRQSGLLSQSNAPGLERSWNESMADEVAFDVFSEHAISRGRSMTCCERAGFPI